MFTFILIVMFTGMLGGLIFALDTSHTHKLTFPWNGDAKDTGWFGHVLIGAGGAVISTAAYVLVARVDLNFIVVLDNPLPYQSGWSANAINQALYFSAVGILGGYSGLRIISGMSDTMVKKLEKELKAQGTRIDQQSNKTQKTEKHIIELEFDNKMQQGILNLYSQNYEQSLSDLDLALATYKRNTDAIDRKKVIALYGWRGNTLKRLGRPDAALDSINLSIKLNDAPKPLHYFNKACYTWLSTENLEHTVRALNDAISIAKAASDVEYLRKILQDDDDLEKFRKDNEDCYQEIINKLEEL